MIRRTLAVTATVAMLLAFPALLKGVFIAPHAVFIDHVMRSAEVTLGAGEVAEEVTVDLAFGYPDTDSAGTPFLNMLDDPADHPSAAGWIRAFPRRVRLEPNDRRTVRLLATPPPGLPDGEYWARLVVEARGASIPVASTDSGVRAGLDLVFRLVVPVTYRKGTVTTGIAITGIEAAVVGDSLEIWLAANRLGNGAWLGTTRFALLTGDGEAVGDWAIPMAVYYPIRRRFAYPLGRLVSGAYQLAVQLATERDDLEEDDVLQAPTVDTTVVFAVP